MGELIEQDSTRVSTTRACRLLKSHTKAAKKEQDQMSAKTPGKRSKFRVKGHSKRKPTWENKPWSGEHLKKKNIMTSGGGSPKPPNQAHQAAQPRGLSPGRCSVATKPFEEERKHWCRAEGGQPQRVRSIKGGARSARGGNGNVSWTGKVIFRSTGKGKSIINQCRDRGGQRGTKSR